MTVVTRTPDRLDEYLTQLSWRVDDARGVRLAAGQSRSLSERGTSFVYVREGALVVHALTTPPRSLRSGDLLLHTGRGSVAVTAEDDAVIVVVKLRGAESVPGFATLPTPVFINDFATIEPPIAQLAASMGCDGPQQRRGDSVICAQIATTVMAVAMRTWVERGCAPATWISDLDDPAISRAVRAIHERPGSQWSVDDLATLATMSRSTFADRFRAVVGASPAVYLAGVRMSMAMDRLARTAVTVTALSHDLGYASEEGFRRAFRRHTGSSPSQWRRHSATVTRST